MDIFVDTNALTLFILGTINRNYIGKHKRISVYAEQEYRLIVGHIKNAKRLVSLPNIWTEVDNLCNGLKGENKRKYSNILHNVVTDSHEKYVESKIITNKSEFLVIGLTDTAILDVASTCDLLITGDSQLANYAESQNIRTLDLKKIANDRLRA